MEVLALDCPDVLLLRRPRYADSRGWFSETYNRKAFVEVGINLDFVQDNHSLSGMEGTVRGLHYQHPPFAQAKLVRVVRGAIFDVAVDIRRSSPTFGRWVSATLSAENGDQLLIPVGYAHGFCTLEPGTEVLYKVSNFYSARHEAGIRWNDPDLGIPWPVAEENALLSDKDRVYPKLSAAVLFD